MVILFLIMPSLDDGKSTEEQLRGFDGIGGVLSISWPIPLLFALQEAGVHYAWKSCSPFPFLNFIVAIVLAIVRETQGIFGKMPVRRVGNEFMETVQKGEAVETKDTTELNDVLTRGEDMGTDNGDPPRKASASAPDQESMESKN
ncbi:hypothetical protein CC80DRAFT_555388 [Byssothecium circinans]|uniref:Uncharacterized protein n=1 Tax=Byssothecium circinans TaxID=147558 RepID=A0A6A5T8Q4_9PLEO|nr:hypothetical protein CC80DRAFT_555388 [Byssothecium circinans]